MPTPWKLVLLPRLDDSLLSCCGEHLHRHGLWEGDGAMVADVDYLPLLPFQLYLRGDPGGAPVLHPQEKQGAEEEVGATEEGESQRAHS